MAALDTRHTDVIERAIRQSIEIAADEAEDAMIDVVTSEINVSRELVERDGEGLEASEPSDQGISVEPSDRGFTVIAAGPRLSLKRFNPRQTSEGVEYSLSSQSPNFVPSAFISEELGGHVYKRTNQPTENRSDPPSRQAIVKLHGPSIPEVVRRSERTEDVLLERVPEFFRDTLERRLMRELTRDLRVDRTS